MDMFGAFGIVRSRPSSVEAWEKTEEGKMISNVVTPFVVLRGNNTTRGFYTEIILQERVYLREESIPTNCH
jgi:hypothetical protein